MFNTILIANRGEIACRIIKTAKSLGIRTIAVYSEADKDSLHTKMADSAFCIGMAAAKDSYLNIEKIIAAAKQSGAEAIHPGYGFLSENPKFAAACAKNNLIFIGPSAESMEAMASKQLAKQRLENTNVPLTPGYHGPLQSAKELLPLARKIGFPILIKAANGGGGKGMRAVYEEAHFEPALESAKRESLASFGDDTVILEKLLQKPRHIEVQIMADKHGNIVHLFERDCSLQRRHQKIIEEAAAFGLDPNLRTRLTEAACEVARSINYYGAGTVEFLVDKDNNFYFMEMNTRLQVEHPVTECITGLDLVALQLKIAAGEALPLSQNEIKTKGHAIECRIYAEDPFNDFVPSIGTINYLKEPKADGIRLDSGISLNSSISQYYDPMLAKLIAYGDNRETALERMQQALRQFYIGGVKTNIPFLQAICQHQEFKRANISTDFLANETINPAKPDKQLALLMTVGYDYLTIYQQIADPLLEDCFAWQLGGLGSWAWRYQDESEISETLVTPINKNQFKLKIKDKIYTIFAQLAEDKLKLNVDNILHQCFVNYINNKLTLYTDKGPISLERFNWNQAQASSSQGQLTAPMPATVVAILKKIGEQVKAGESLIVLEAMKMEHTVHAPRDGVLSEIFYTVGSQVDEGARLLALSD